MRYDIVVGDTTAAEVVAMRAAANEYMSVTQLLTGIYVCGCAETNTMEKPQVPGNKSNFK